MKLTNYPTNPSIRTILEFGEHEVIEALIDYTKKAGYVYDDERVSVWYPRHSNYNESLKLVIDCNGAKPAISLEENK